MVSLEKLVQSKHNLTNDFQEVNRIGDLLHEYLCQPKVYKQLEEANRPGNSSSQVQSVFLDYAAELGFHSERTGLFDNYPTSGLRPDYFLKTKNSGILLEVERGKTIMNNMDLLDLWKCHICSEANYLYLMVPNKLTHNVNSRPYNVFNKVIDRMTPFFREENHTNVYALFVYGY